MPARNNNKRRNNRRNQNKRKQNVQTSSKKVPTQSKFNRGTENENKINDTESKHQCEFCGKAGVSSHCGGCKVVYYCNKQCQSSDWKLHKTLCKFYRTDHYWTHYQIDNHLFMENNLNKKKYYIKRIDFLLTIYQEFNKNGKYDKYDDIYYLICAHYPELKINYFIKDYNEYVQHIDENKMYLQNKCECDIMQCAYVMREYRDRNIYDQNKKQRHKLYNNCNSEKCVVVQQLLDQLHIIKYHLLDLGLRYNEDMNHNQNRKKFRRMKTVLSQKRKVFNSLRKDRDITKNTKSKFVTHIVAFDEEKEDNSADGCQYTNYGFGVRFYYHPYYKHKKITLEQIPGASKSWMDAGNMFMKDSYTFADWFVSPTYQSIKDEVLNGKSIQISLIEYINTREKAIMKLNGLKHMIPGSRLEFETVYGIKRGSRITIQHILAIMLYTNFTELSAEFSQSFRKLTGEESDKSLIQRHSKYAHWGKYLREAIDLWGTRFGESQDSKPFFYHGLSCKMVFDGYNQFFCGPTSTTLQYSTAVMFANQGQGDGIVITIKNDGSICFFNCIPWSDFAGEWEMLFVGGLHAVEIIGLTEINEGLNHDKWIKVLKTFSMSIQGISSTDRILNKDKDMINALIGSVLWDDNKNNNVKSISLYVQTLFRHLLRKTTVIGIDVGTWNKDICWRGVNRTQYGYKKIRHIYFDKEDNIKWSTLLQLYPSVEQIRILCMENIPLQPNELKCVSSILIDDNLLLSIWSYLCNVKNKRMDISICQPKNIESLDSLINKHSEMYSTLSYTLGKKRHYDSPVGDYDEFFITSN